MVSTAGTNVSAAILYSPLHFSEKIKLLLCFTEKLTIFACDNNEIYKQ
jgi:hypothetical protein